MGRRDVSAGAGERQGKIRRSIPPVRVHNLSIPRLRRRPDAATLLAAPGLFLWGIAVLKVLYAWSRQGGEIVDRRVGHTAEFVLTPSLRYELDAGSRRYECLRPRSILVGVRHEPAM